MGCAGSTWAWQPPSNLNPFWVRRYASDWNQGQAKEAEKPPVRPKESEKPKERNVSCRWPVLS